MSSNKTERKSSVVQIIVLMVVFGMIVAAWLGVRYGEQRGQQIAQQLDSTSLPTSDNQGGSVIEVTTRVSVSPTSYTSPDATQPISTATPQQMPESQPFSFTDSFDGPINNEWKIVKSGINTREGRLTGRGGMISIDPKSDNYRINLKVRGTNFKITLRSAFERGDILEGYAVGCRYSECGWSIYKNGKSINGILEGRGEYETDKFYDMTIVVEGRNISTHIGDENFSFADETFQSGDVGVQIDETSSEIDDFTINALP